MTTYNNEYFLKTGDRSVDLEATLYSESGAVVDLTGYSVVFSMQLDGGTTNKVDAASCEIVSAVAGTIKYEWQAADVDTAGTYKGEFVATDGSGLEVTFPRRKSDPYLTIVISESV